MVMICGQVALQNYFHRKRARALSLSLCGPAFSMLIFTEIIFISWNPISSVHLLRKMDSFKIKHETNFRHIYLPANYKISHRYLHMERSQSYPFSNKPKLCCVWSFTTISTHEKDPESKNK